ncbi:MAG: hypothetical protein P9E67_10920 [Candidatus Competibacter sp.]|jgi:hypothetical protein|nr:hypothetical protein [Candidatus Competibacter sp.]
MGILERLNRTFKHEFVFRHEVKTLADLKALLLQGNRAMRGVDKKLLTKVTGGG